VNDFLQKLVYFELMFLGIKLNEIYLQATFTR